MVISISNRSNYYKQRLLNIYSHFYFRALSLMRPYQAQNDQMMQMGTNQINIICCRFQKVSRIRIRILVFGLKYSNNIRIPNYSLTSEGYLKRSIDLR